MNWFYYDQRGEKQGPISDLELHELIAQQLITPDTQLETESGHTGKARQVPGLFLSSSSPRESVSPPQQATGPFCTHCGSPIAAQAAVCMSCGCRPHLSNNFCRQCGGSMTPEQVLCISCGAPVQSGPVFPGNSGYNEEIPDYLGWAVAELLVCNFLFGIIAIIYASEANSAKERGDYNTARQKAVIASRWLWAGVWLAVISVTIGVGLVVIAIAANA